MIGEAFFVCREGERRRGRDGDRRLFGVFLVVIFVLVRGDGNGRGEKFVGFFFFCFCFCGVGGCPLLRVLVKVL